MNSGKNVKYFVPIVVQWIQRLVHVFVQDVDSENAYVIQFAENVAML